MSVKTYLENAWLPYYFLPLLVVAAVAYIDVIGWQMFKAVENPSSTYIAMESLYMSLFHGLVYLSILGPTAVVYYYQGIGAGLAYFSWAFAVIYSGVWDIMYYLYRDGVLPEHMNHLLDAPPGYLANLVGVEKLTPEIVIVNIIVFLSVGLFLAYSFRRGRLSSFV